MANAAMATPNVLTDPGFLYWAPLGTALPANTVPVGGSAFTDTWPTAWIPLGATEDGSEFTYSTSVDAVRVAEFFDPIRWATTERGGNFAFNLADWTLSNVKRAFNGGALTITAETTTSGQINSYEPPDPGAEVRAMIGWESLDNSARIIARQCINSGDISQAFRRAPSLAVIPCQFQMEKPASARPFVIYTAGTVRD
jgi:hypothetical protein